MASQGDITRLLRAWKGGDEAALELLIPMIGPELRVPGVFGPEQPCADDAPITQRLFAFSGRKV